MYELFHTLETYILLEQTLPRSPDQEKSELQRQCSCGQWFLSLSSRSQDTYSESYYDIAGLGNVLCLKRQHASPLEYIPIVTITEDQPLVDDRIHNKNSSKYYYISLQPASFIVK